jgi:hypothetical protein
MVDHVAERRFPQLERRHGGSVSAASGTAPAALAGMLALLVVSLPRG